MPREPQSGVVVLGESAQFQEASLEVPVPAPAVGRFLDSPQRYVREFLERSGQTVNQVLFAVGEGKTLAACYVRMAVAETTFEAFHISGGPHKSAWIIY